MGRSRGSRGRSRRRSRARRGSSGSGQTRRGALRAEVKALREELDRRKGQERAAAADRRAGFETSGGGKAGKQRKGRTPRTPEGREGDWDCEACAESNWSWRPTCRVCQCSRVGLKAALQQAAATGANRTPLAPRAAAPPAAAGPATPPPQHPPADPPAPTAQGSAAGTGGAGQQGPGMAAAGGSSTGAPAQASAAEQRKLAAATRARESDCLARLDAAIEILPEGSAARVALAAERAETAGRLAATRPLGHRLATARKKWEAASKRLQAAEAAATAATREAQAALEAEHAAAGELQTLEAQVNGQRGLCRSAVAAPAAAFLDGMNAWLGACGAAVPPELLQAAAALREALAPTVASPTEESSPTEAADSDDELLPDAAGAGATPGVAAAAGQQAGQQARPRDEDAMVAVRAPAPGPARSCAAEWAERAASAAAVEQAGRAQACTVVQQAGPAQAAHVRPAAGGGEPPATRMRTEGHATAVVPAGAPGGATATAGR